MTPTLSEALPAAPTASPTKALSLWAIASDRRHIAAEIEELAAQLDDEDEAARAETITALEQLLEADLNNRAALEAKCDAYLAVIRGAEAAAAFASAEAKRLAQIAKTEQNRAERLKDTLLNVLLLTDPDATTFKFRSGALRSKLTRDVVTITDPLELPEQCFAVKREPSKTLIKEAILASDDPASFPGATLGDSRSWRVA